MKRFCTYDQAEFEDLEAIAHHEAAHAVVAYFFGFEIGRFRTHQYTKEILTGAVKSDPNSAMIGKDLNRDCTEKAIKLFAGEVACRIFTKHPTDEVVIPLNGAERIRSQMSLTDIIYKCSEEPNHDGTKILIAASEVRPLTDWWSWVWERHDRAVELVNENWEHVESLAKVFYTALQEPDQCIGCRWLKFFKHAPAGLRPNDWPQGSSIVTGRYIINHLNKRGVTVNDPMIRPRAI